MKCTNTYRMMSLEKKLYLSNWETFNNKQMVLIIFENFSRITHFPYKHIFCVIVYISKSFRVPSITDKFQLDSMNIRRVTNKNKNEKFS